MAEGKFVLYHYNPSLPAAVIFIVLFGVSACCHMFQLLRSKTWYFIPFLIGCTCKLSQETIRTGESDEVILIVEAVGYAGRAISATQTPDWTTLPYVIQSLLLLLGPTLLAASIYMVLGRLVVLLDGHSLSLIRPKWLTKVFVLGDVISFLAQSGGKEPNRRVLQVARNHLADDVVKEEACLRMRIHKTIRIGARISSSGVSLFRSSSSAFSWL